MFDRGHMNPLAFGAGARDNGARRLSSYSRSDQTIDKRVKIVSGHVNDHRGLGRNLFWPVLAVPAILPRTGEKNQSRRYVAMGERNLERRCSSHGRGYTRYNFQADIEAPKI